MRYILHNVEVMSIALFNRCSWTTGLAPIQSITPWCRCAPGVRTARPAHARREGARREAIRETVFSSSHGPHSERWVFHLPLGLDSFQLRRLDLEADPRVAACDGVAHGDVVVWSGALVWVGVLPVYRLALAGPGPARISRSAVV